MKTGTSPKTLRIPNDIIADIEETAKEKKTTFSKEAIRRLRNKGDSDTKSSIFLAKVQTIIGLSFDAYRFGREDLFQKAQEEHIKLWKRTMTSSK